MNIESFKEIEDKFSEIFSRLSTIQSTIRQKLAGHADGKTLKGNELVGWLGEIYGKYLFNGYLVDDSFEHDVETQDGLRISVKTRKGTKKGWNRTSAIPKIEGDDCPTHLLFVHLNDNYLVENMWLYPWNELHVADRFKKHTVRGNMRSYYMQVNKHSDIKHLIFNK